MNDINDIVPLIEAIIIIAFIIKALSISGHINPESNHTGGSQTMMSVDTSQHQYVGEGETGPVIYYAKNPHGRLDKEYRFNYIKVNGSWRAYILRMPPLNGRDPSGYITHRHYDNEKPYICWDTNVNSLKDMQAISRVWADSIQEYIATGKRFG